MTPLLWMAYYDQAESIKLLLEHGANLHAKNRDGSTALIIASEQNAEGPETVTFLLEQGCNVNATDSVS
jgi:ankyrin repeat protein